jgi:undecaprenyl-diphosphatase
LPVSSSAHTILIPLLAGWRYDELDPALRKSFEVSLHAAGALAIGCAQAIALAPGVSRSGAALVAARVRGFDGAAAQALSWSAALPVMLGAALLSARRAIARGLPAGSAPMLTAGAGAAFVSTLVATHGVSRTRGRTQRLAAIALYRLALGAFVLARLARGRCRRGHPLP